MLKLPRKVASYSLSLEALRLLVKLTVAKGLNKSSVLETLIREEARKLGVE